MNDNIILHGLSAEANGEILPADSLVGIDKDDCMLWPFTRQDMFFDISFKSATAHFIWLSGFAHDSMHFAFQ